MNEQELERAISEAQEHGDEILKRLMDKLPCMSAQEMVVTFGVCAAFVSGEVDEGTALYVIQRQLRRVK